MLNNYQGRCAVTGCVTPEALEAAHILRFNNKDLNDPANGILLRKDIHVLLDSWLITLSEDGSRLDEFRVTARPVLRFSAQCPGF